MAYHPDSIRKMRRWELVDAKGDVAMSAESVTATAVLERARPVDVAKREARLRNNPLDPPVYAWPAV